MANDQKINGSFEGNKLNISITTSSSDKATEPAQSIESTGKKVSSIAEQSSRQQKDDLNKKVVKQDKSISSNAQEIQVLKEISQKLSALNDAVISIQHKENIVKNEDASDANKSAKRLDEEIFTSNFSESLKNSFKSLLDDSSFRTKMNIMFDGIFSNSVLLKQSDIDTLSESLESAISNSNYTVSSSEKASDQTVQINNFSETMDKMNETVKTMVDSINNQTENFTIMNQSNEQMMKDYQAATISALNSNTKDQEINAISDAIKEAVEKAKENEKVVDKPTTDQIDKSEGKSIEDKAIVNNIERQVDVEESKFAKDDAEKAKHDEEFNEQLLEKFDENEERDDKVIESLDTIIDERKQEAVKKAAMIESKKQADESKQKTFLGILKGLTEKPLNLIKKGGKALSLGGAGSLMRNNESEKTLAAKKTAPSMLLKEQKTISTKDDMSSVRDMSANMKQFMMNQDKTQTASLASRNQATAKVAEIASILTGFAALYKKVADENREREIYKLRFGSEEKKDDSILNKLLSKLGKDKKTIIKKEKPEKESKGGGILSWILGLLGAGLGLFKMGFGNLIWGRY